jgi:transcriptional regulator GlxA family with amidase domain
LTGGVTGGAAARPSRCRYVDALTTAFLGRIIRRYGRRHTEARNWGTSIHDDTIRRTLAYLDRHLAEDIGVESAARHVGLSQQHFADIFKTATGETVWQHVRRRRLQRGRDMLGGTTLSVEEVARQVGYASASHFATAFKSMFGQPPGSYRTDALGKGDHGRKAVGGKAES